MKDEQWKYLLETTMVSGEGEDAIRFQRMSYANDLLVPFYEMLNLDAAAFGAGDRPARLSGLTIEQVKLFHQPSKEVVAITRHYPKGGRYFYGGTGLYIETFVPVKTLEQIMGVSFAPMYVGGLPDNFLRLGTYNQKKSNHIIEQDGVGEITEAISDKRFQQGIGIYDLDIFHRRFSGYRSPDFSYSFNTIKEAIGALTDQDLTTIGRPTGITSDPTSRSIQISRIAEPIIDVERHPPYLDSPVTGVPGIFYTVPVKEFIEEIIAPTVDLFVLPHFEKDKYYFQVAGYRSSTDNEPEPVPAFAQLRKQLSTPDLPDRLAVTAPYRVDFHYQVAGDGTPQTVSTNYATAPDAIEALKAIPPAAFDAKNFKREGKILQSATLVSTTDDTLVASMFKTTTTGSRLPGGIYIVIDKERLTPALASAMGPILSKDDHAGHHFLVAKAGELAGIWQKHAGKPRTLGANKDTGKHH